MMIQYQAAKHDVGIGYFSCVQGDADPDLVRLSPPKPTIDIWLLSHRDLRAAARMRAFRQFITKRRALFAATLEGRNTKEDQ